jgi:CHAT domain-containing protein/tetratricopeptide (TPR) repeat protein
VCLTRLALVVVVWLSGQAGPATLRMGAPIERELGAAETHVYHVSLQAGDYLRVAIEREAIGADVLVHGPDGRLILSSSQHPGVRPDRPVIVASLTGDHRITIAGQAAAPDSKNRGRYRIGIEELRPAEPNDRSLAEAERTYSEGLTLGGTDTAESLQAGRALLRESIAHWQAAGDRAGEAYARHCLARFEGILGEPRRAIEDLRAALAIFREVGDRKAELDTLGTLGTQLYAAGEYREAARELEALLAMHRERQDLPGVATTLSDLGAVSFGLAEPLKAVEYNDAAARIWRDTNVRSYEAVALSNAGTIYRDLGEYQRAFDNFRAALALRRAAGDRRGEAITLQHLASLQHALGRFPDALDLSRQALRLHRLVGSRLREGQTLLAMARTEQALGRAANALSHAQGAAAIFKAAGNAALEGQALVQVAALRLDASNHAGARHAATDALARCRAAGHRRCEAQALRELGRIASARGDSEPAAEALEAALAHFRAMHSPSGEADTLLALARVERARGRLEAARAYADATLSLIESERTRVASGDLRASYVAARHDAYALMIDLLMQMHAVSPEGGSPERGAPERRFDREAFDVSERARARSLLDLLVASGADVHEGVDPVLAEEERSLRQRLTAQDANHMQLLERAETGARLQRLDRDIRQTLLDLGDLRARIAARSPRYAAISDPRPLSAEDIQRDVLDEDTVLLQYALLPDRSIVWVVTKQAIASHVLPGKRAIERAARRVHDLVTLSHTRQRRREAERAADELSAMVLAPVLADTKAAKRLVIVADGALQFVPFAALRAAGTPLLSRHDEIVYLPSASALAVLRRDRSARPPATALAAVLADPVLSAADPRVAGSAAVAETAAVTDVMRSARESGVVRFERLPFTRREADAIRARVGGAGTMIALDFDANLTTAVSGALAPYRLVHIATHGLVNSRHPELSGLVLSLVDEQGRARDGFLRSHDIYNLRLAADLVVLSGCQTALGHEIRGEGLIGLVRAFMYAGAPRVVASLWNVRDEATSALMDRFYLEMIDHGQPPSAALHRAQRWMSRHPRWSAPYYWAGFVLQGEWR